MVLLRAGLARVLPQRTGSLSSSHAQGSNVCSLPRGPLLSGDQHSPPHLNARLLLAVPPPLRRTAHLLRGRAKRRPSAPSSNQATPAFPSLTFPTRTTSGRAYFSSLNLVVTALSHLWRQQQGEQVLAHRNVTSRWRQAPASCRPHPPGLIISKI